MRHLWAIALPALFAPTLLAAPLVNGVRDAQYGPALAVQTVNTGFGDNFSELDAAYAVIDSGRLYLMLTGNLEANFNKLEIFIDSKAGGQSVFDSSGNDNAQRMDGLRFDSGFTADYHLIARRGTDSGNPRFDLDFANLGAQSASGYFDFLAGSGFEGSGSTGTGVNALPIELGYDNSNTAGVAGGNTAADQTAAAAVTTGLELSIALSDLGYVGGPINVMVGVNGGGHDFFSNQFLAGLNPPQGNLGGDGNGNFTGVAPIDFTAVAGNQYFTVVVPEPAALTLASLVSATLLSRRRRT